MRLLHIVGLKPKGEGYLSLPEGLEEALKEAFGSLANYIKVEEAASPKSDRLIQSSEAYCLEGRGQISLREFAHRSQAALTLVSGLVDASFPALVFGEESEAKGLLAKVLENGQASLSDGRSFQLPEENQEFAAALEEKLFPALAGIECGKCEAGSCGGTRDAILRAESGPEACVAQVGPVTMRFDGREVGLVPFVEKMLANVVDGMAKEMKGYENPRTIEVIVRRENL